MEEMRSCPLATGRVSLVIRSTLAAVLYTASLSAQPDAEPAPASAAGNSADAASDSASSAEGTAEQPGSQDCTPACRPGYACVQGECVSACNPPCGAGEVCTASLQCVPDPDAGLPPGAEPDLPEGDRAHRLVGVRGFGGIVLGGGVTLHSFVNADRDGLEDPVTAGAFIFALRAGLFVNRNEISVELAPGTCYPILGADDPAVDNDESITSFLGSYAHHIEMTRGAYWAFRFGAGLIHRSHGSRLDGTHFQGRIDLLNISVKTKYVFLDFSFPSVRYVSDFDLYHRWTGLFTAGVSYISP
jgi:hypothetical protein